MVYPRAIVTMAQNLIREAASKPDIPESKFYMLWNAVLNHHFPIGLEYGVALQTSTKGECTFLVVKFARERESIVLVVLLKTPDEDTAVGRDSLKKDLAGYIDECFVDTDYETIYGIGGIGLSWSAYKMEDATAPDLELLHDWTSNITAFLSYEWMHDIVALVERMKGTVREQVWLVPMQRVD
jgi:hypothetical protein